MNQRSIMYKFYPFVLILVLLGCATSPQYISDSKEYTSAGIDNHDIQSVINASIYSLTKSKIIKKIPQDSKILAISDFVNDTQDDIDLEVLSRKFVSKILDNDIFMPTNVIAGNASTTDSMLKNTRKLRENDDFNENSIIQKKNLLSPNYSLSGRVVQRIKNVGKKERLDYDFLFTITDIKTGLVVWDNIVSISKNKK